MALSGQAKIWYVKEGGAGVKNGNSWADASGDLQDILNRVTANGTVDEVYVAAGTYKPNRIVTNVTAINTGNRDNAFFISRQMKIYGGFPATGSPVFADRDWEVHKTILSGDQTNPAVTTDNCYHVMVMQTSTSRVVVVDGLIITEGVADGSTDNNLAGFTLSRSKGGGGIICQVILLFLMLRLSITQAWVHRGMAADGITIVTILR